MKEIRDKPHNQNRTEYALYKSMVAIGLNPEPQYKISEMTVDFAFPNEKLVVEVNGSHHNEEEYQIKDHKRLCILNNLGWSKKAYKASSVFKHPDFIAEKIKEHLESITKFEVPKNEVNEEPVAKKRSFVKYAIAGCVVIGILFVIFFTSQTNYAPIGAFTGVLVPKYDCATNKFDCSSFGTQREAQVVFEQCGGSANDIHWLDSNRDGVACESLP